MLDNYKNNSIAIIPARGGSKRIPRKNIKPFLGIPIIKYSIDAAINSKCFNEVMVSTDDREIAEISQSIGAQIPFLRSESNSNDYASTSDVILEVLNNYKSRGIDYKYACCIYPAAPFIKENLIKQAMKMLIESDVDAIVPVVKFSYPIQRAFIIDNGNLKMLHPENYLLRSQDLPPSFHDCGQFYCFNTNQFFKQFKLFMENTLPIIIPERYAQDIDTEEDWAIAEIKFKLIHGIC